MDNINAMCAFAALSQNTRLNAFLMLVEYAPEGLPAGKLAEKLDVPCNTLSTHLRSLQDAGLVDSRRDSRQIIYRARVDQIDALATFLMKRCCGGNGKKCAQKRKG